MASRLLQHTKDLRPMDKTDREYLEAIYAGKNLDARGMERLFSIGIENSVKNIHAHNSYLNSLSEGDTGLGLMPGFRNAYRVNLPTDETGAMRMTVGGPTTPAPSGWSIRPAP